MGAPEGNNNAGKNREWKAAIGRALTKRGLGDRAKALDDLAEKLLSNCDTGDMAALKELGDRVDGKVAQAIIGGEGDDPPINVVNRVVREIVRPNAEPKNG